MFRKSQFTQTVFEDNKGKVVLWQSPNIALYCWIIFFVISILTNGIFELLARFLAYASLSLWALLEIFTGVNWFRRVLGIVILGNIVVSILQV